MLEIAMGDGPVSDANVEIKLDRLHDLQVRPCSGAGRSPGTSMRSCVQLVTTGARMLILAE